MLRLALLWASLAAAAVPLAARPSLRRPAPVEDDGPARRTSATATAPSAVPINPQPVVVPCPFNQTNGGGPQDCSFHPTPVPTRTFAPTGTPSVAPSPAPSLFPSAAPTAVPSPVPAPRPTPRPTSLVPTGAPTTVPVPAPTGVPSAPPTGLPTLTPSPAPTGSPSLPPSPAPSGVPVSGPTPAPSVQPSPHPSGVPTRLPTMYPTPAPSTLPSPLPTATPTMWPTPAPSAVPVPAPTGGPSFPPSPPPTTVPSIVPTPKPSTPEPTGSPSLPPSPAPSVVPSPLPTNVPTMGPTPVPSPIPTPVPSPLPSPVPTSVQFQTIADTTNRWAVIYAGGITLAALVLLCCLVRLVDRKSCLQAVDFFCGGARDARGRDARSALLGGGRGGYDADGPDFFSAGYLAGEGARFCARDLKRAVFALLGLVALLATALNVALCCDRPEHDYAYSDDPVWRADVHAYEAMWTWYVEHGFAAALGLCLFFSEIRWPLRFRKRLRVLKFAGARGACWIVVACLTLVPPARSIHKGQPEPWYYWEVLYASLGLAALGALHFVFGFLEALLVLVGWLTPDAPSKSTLGMARRYYEDL